MLDIHVFWSVGTTAVFRWLVFIVLVDFIFRIFVLWRWFCSNPCFYSRWHTSIQRFSVSFSSHWHSLKIHNINYPFVWWQMLPDDLSRNDLAPSCVSNILVPINEHCPTWYWYSDLTPFTDIPIMVSIRHQNFYDEPFWWNWWHFIHIWTSCKLTVMDQIKFPLLTAVRAKSKQVLICYFSWV
jgi:hypothetical protein